jgi:hypothetical protein
VNFAKENFCSIESDSNPKCKEGVDKQSNVVADIF